ncbi:MFS transporter [Leuconostoc fallax]|uniref:Yip1 domain-containing protein n=1 Tax=Leuconostoc fallax TaxID=1251 RepID=A0A4R5N856_9LACO|nr:MFS transporter [Leuconostoc fallax]MBU7455788.1 MFS transporter [Leuconostoc fallax]TDG67971.1 hypothetical protein C5L23_000277 [Leuconostoc fallax]
MSKKNQVIIAIVGTLVALGITAINILNTNEVDGMKLDSKLLPMILIVGLLSTFIFTLVSALINKLFIWLSQLGQEEAQSVTFMTSWYATIVSQLPVMIINVFAIIVLNLYKADNGIAAIIGGVVSAILFTFILRQNNTITKRTQIIYVIIMVILTLALNFKVFMGQ